MDGAREINVTGYDDDCVAWAREQAGLLKARNWGAVDWPNVIEEIEDLGKSERRSLASALARIMEHLIKLDYGTIRDPERGWQVTVETQRIDAERILEENPSLKRELPDLIAQEYPRARRLAMAGFTAHESDRLGEYERVVPTDCPYAVKAVLGEI